jgi:predicted GNAT family acetyltransferase
MLAVMADILRSVDDRLDEMLDQTVPASDSPGNTVETGVAMGLADASSAPVQDNLPEHRFEIVRNGDTAFLVYERKPDAMVLVHTEVPSALRGQGVGNDLVEAALAAAHSEGLRVVAVCPFVRAYMRKRSERLS